MAATACVVAVFFLADMTHDLAHAPLPALAGAETFCEDSTGSQGPARDSDSGEPGKDCRQPGCGHHFHGYPDRTPAAPVIVALGSKPLSSDPSWASKRLRSLPNDSGRSPPLA